MNLKLVMHRSHIPPLLSCTSVPVTCKIACIAQLGFTASR